MGGAFPVSRFGGRGFPTEGIEAARAEGARCNPANARFEVADTTAGLLQKFELVTAFDLIRRLPTAGAAVAHIAAHCVEKAAPRSFFYAVAP